MSRKIMGEAKGVVYVPRRKFLLSGRLKIIDEARGVTLVENVVCPVSADNLPSGDAGKDAIVERYRSRVAEKYNVVAAWLTHEIKELEGIHADSLWEYTVLQ